MVNGILSFIGHISVFLCIYGFCMYRIGEYNDYKPVNLFSVLLIFYVGYAVR